MSTDFLVVVPTYRRDTVVESVNSVLAQQGITANVVVVDDCPNGSAEKMVTALNDKRVTYVKNLAPSNGRPSSVRNFGVSYARKNNIAGDILHFLDDDDLVPPGYYTKVKTVFAGNNKIGVVFGIIKPFAVLSEDQQRRARQQEQLGHEVHWCDDAARTAQAINLVGYLTLLPAAKRFLFAAQALFGEPIYVCSSATIRSEHFDTLGGFDVNIRLMEDNEFFSRAIRRFGGYFINETSVYWRVGSSSSLMHAVDITKEQKAAEQKEISAAIKRKFAKLKKELGALRFFSTKILYRGGIRPLIITVKSATKLDFTHF